VDPAARVTGKKWDGPRPQGRLRPSPHPILATYPMPASDGPCAPARPAQLPRGSSVRSALSSAPIPRKRPARSARVLAPIPRAPMNRLPHRASQQGFAEQPGTVELYFNLYRNMARQPGLSLQITKSVLFRNDFDARTNRNFYTTQ
jgi:hypothetical protein